LSLVYGLALFDSGATYSWIRPDIARELDVVNLLPEKMVFGTAKNGDQLIATERTTLNFFLKDCRFSDEFMLIPDLSEELIIGAKTLQAWRMKLDFEADDVIIDPRVTRLCRKPRILLMDECSLASTPP
jgi:hypothetical protein